MKNTVALISNKQKKSQHYSSNATNLATASYDNDTDSIVDQDVDVVMAGVPNHSFLSLLELQGEVFDNDEGWFAKWCIHILLIKNPDLASACINKLRHIFLLFYIFLHL